MGLLTNTSKPEHLTKFIIKYQAYLCAVLYVAGVAWLFALAYNPNNAETYFSENALLPGLVDAEFSLDHDANLYLERLLEEMERHQSDMPTAWLLGQFRQLGLEVYRHNFSLEFPLGDRYVYGGNNVYAILRAPRAASTEALVLAAPFRPPTSVLGGTAPGIAVMLAAAKFFAAKTYLAKDLIFLITEHEQLGAKAWLEAYHGTRTPGGVIRAGSLLARSGNIQAAINLELHDKSLAYVDIKIEGLNGQLPNLDLFNLVVKLCKRESIQVTFHNYPSHYYPRSFDGWLNNVWTMVAMVQSQATGVPTGNHGQFLSHNIEAVTIEGYKMKRGRGASFKQFGRVVEGVFRSLNNLLESLHQSFFFYLLPATDRYISIGVYMLPFGSFLAAIVLAALKLHLVLEKTRDTDGDDEGKKETLDPLSKRNRKNSASLSSKTDIKPIKADKKSTSHEKRNDKDSSCDERSSADKSKIEKRKTRDATANNDNKARKTPLPKEKSRKETLVATFNPGSCSLVSVIPCEVVTHTIGLGVLLSPHAFGLLATRFDRKVEDGVMAGLITTFLIVLTLPLILFRSSSRSPVAWQLLKCAALLEMALLVATLSLVNFSLALLLAIFIAPVFMFVVPSKSRLLRFIRSALLLLASPLGVTFLAVLLSTWDLNPSARLDTLLQRSLYSWKRGVTYAVTDSYIFDNWLFSVTCLLQFPIWTQLWCVAHSPINSISS